MATPIRTTILNVLLNPYEGKRPKNPEKVYDLNTIFGDLGKRSFPIKMKDPTNKQIKSIVIQTAFACLPGGRGCVGKDRMGTKLLNRQISVIHEKGSVKNPIHKNKSIGFIQLLGTIEYKDGTVSNLSVPIESSGVIGVRTGGITMNPNNIENMKSAIIEIENHLLRLVNFKKVRNHKIVMINGTFNMFSSASKQNRPRVSNFIKFLDTIYKNGLNELYKKPTMPWQNRQGGPSVVKAIFRSDTLPTLMITPLGHCEVMGASSFENVIQTYKLVSKTFSKIKNNTSFNKPTVDSSTKVTYKLNKDGKLVASNKTRSYTKRPKMNISIQNQNLRRVGNTLMIKSKKCELCDKRTIQRIADQKGVSSRGTRAAICDRILNLY